MSNISTQPGLFKRVYLPALAIILLLAGGLLGPRLLSFVDQLRAGRMLEQALDTSGITTNGLRLCESLPGEVQTSTREYVDQSIILLHRAIQRDPAATQSYRLLGQALCLQGNPQDAVRTLVTYTQMRPNNFLGVLELGFAYVAACDPNNGLSDQNLNRSSNVGFCQEGSLKTHILRRWRQAGINADQVYNRADLAFNQQDYQTVLAWFEVARLLDGKPDRYRQFKWMAASIVTGEPLPEFLDADAIPVHTLSTPVQIDGEDLIWMRAEDAYWNIRNGQRLSEHPSGIPAVGGLWWQGAGVTFIQAPCTTEYQIKIRAMHQSSADQPGNLQINIDEQPVAKITLLDNWQVFQVTTTISEGHHLLSVHYVEDVGDVLVNWVRLDPLAGCNS